jgi:hypothetical protein
LLRNPIAFRKPIAIRICNAKYEASCKWRIVAVTLVSARHAIYWTGKFLADPQHAKSLRLDIRDEWNDQRLPDRCHDGRIASSSELSLTRDGVVGESLTRADELGRFAFTSLPSGEYCLGVHDNRYAPLYRDLILEEGETIENLEIALTPAAFIKGRILDEEGHPPQRCHVTLITEGTRKGRFGYINDYGDHKVAQDGRFSSPPLRPDRYFLLFAGILRTPSASTPSQATQAAMQQRIFDFLHPNAQDVKDACPFDLQIGQTMTELEVRVPRPIWRTVRGKLTGALPGDLANICVLFTRDVGMLDDLSSGGAKVNADGTFEGCAQPGRHRFNFWEMAPPQPKGYSRGTKQFASVEVIVGDRDLDEVEIQISPTTMS